MPEPIVHHLDPWNDIVKVSWAGALALLTIKGQQFMSITIQAVDPVEDSPVIGGAGDPPIDFSLIPFPSGDLPGFVGQQKWMFIASGTTDVFVICEVGPVLHAIYRQFSGASDPFEVLQFVPSLSTLNAPNSFEPWPSVDAPDISALPTPQPIYLPFERQPPTGNYYRVDTDQWRIEYANEPAPIWTVLTQSQFILNFGKAKKFTVEVSGGVLLPTALQAAGRVVIPPPDTEVVFETFTGGKYQIGEPVDKIGQVVTATYGDGSNGVLSQRLSNTAVTSTGTAAISQTRTSKSTDDATFTLTASGFVDGG